MNKYNDIKKNVLFIIDHLNTGGIQEFILNYCKIIKQHKVTVLSLFKNDVYSQSIKKEGGKVIFLIDMDFNYFNIITFKVFKKFKKFIFENYKFFNVIHIKTFASFFYASILNLYKYKNVTAGIDGSNIQLPIIIRIMYFIFARKYNIFFIPQCYLKEFQYLKINKEKLVAMKYFTTIRKTKSPYKFPHEFNILTIGRCIKQKGFIRVINLFNCILKYIQKDMGLYIIGDGPYLSKIKSYIYRNNIPHVYCLGQIGNYEDYLIPADLIIKMAIGEGINSVVREAMIIGKFVATTIETSECNNFKKQHIIIPLSKYDLNKNAKYLVNLINNRFENYDKNKIKQISKKLWGNEQVIAQNI